MTTSIRFCLSYDPLKWKNIAFNINIVSIKKRIADTNVISDITCTHQNVISRVGIRFYDTKLSTYLQRRHMINTCSNHYLSVTGKAVGIAVGFVAGLLLFIVVLVVLYKKRKRYDTCATYHRSNRLEFYCLQHSVAV